jgi:hypothetical protein
MRSSSLIIEWANHPRLGRAAPYACAQDSSACFVSLRKREMGPRGQFPFWPDSPLRQPPTLQGGPLALRVFGINNNSSAGVTPSVRQSGYFFGPFFELKSR